MTCWAIIQQYKTKQPFIRRERRPHTKCLMSKLQMPDTIIWWIWNTTSIDLDRCCLCYYKILGIRRICASSRGYNTLLSSLYVIQRYEAFSDLVQRYSSHRTISVNCSKYQQPWPWSETKLSSNSFIVSCSTSYYC